VDSQAGTRYLQVVIPQLVRRGRGDDHAVLEVDEGKALPGFVLPVG